MGEFAYKATDLSGRIFEGAMEGRDEKAVVGAMKILCDAYQDSTADEDIWSAIDVAPAWQLKTPVTLSSIKAEPSLKDIHLVRVARLSVMPLEKDAFDRIVAMGDGTAKIA